MKLSDIVQHKAEWLPNIVDRIDILCGKYDLRVGQIISIIANTQSETDVFYRSNEEILEQLDSLIKKSEGKKGN